jgi:alkaline phosphatase D
VQLAWLLAGLRASTAQFKVLVSPSVMNEGGTADGWTAYFAEERDAILDFIADERIGGVVVLSGDRHRTEVWRLRQGGEGSYPIYEFVSSNLANSSSDCKQSKHGSRLFCHTGTEYFGWLHFRMTLAAPELTYEARTTDGSVVYRLVLTASELSVPHTTLSPGPARGAAGG